MSLPGAVASTKPAHVSIVEVSPRDGLQNEAVMVSTADKIALIKRLTAAGARRIETVAFVHPRLVPQMADAEAVMAGLAPDPGVSYIGLVLNDRGLDRALASGVNEVNYVVSATNGFSERNQGAPLTEVIAAWPGIAGRAKSAGLGVSLTVSTAFGCPFDGPVAQADLLAVVRSCLDGAIPDELALGDTIGVGVPAQVTDRFGAIRQLYPSLRLRAHFHNTRNTGYANAWAAYLAGVAVLDASAGGIGGCPFAPKATGNIATEDLVYLLDTSEVASGIDLSAMSATGIWVAGMVGKAAPALLGRAGPFPG